MLKDVLIKEGLSNREAEVAELVTQGLSNKEVANRLFVTEKTVKFHLTNIYKKMNVKSRAQLIVWCLPNMSFTDQAPESGSSNDNRNISNVNIPVGNNNGGDVSTKPYGTESEEGATPDIIPGQANKSGYSF